jgi:transcriptional regulator with XRE-family HTH domain
MYSHQETMSSVNIPLIQLVESKGFTHRNCARLGLMPDGQVGARIKRLVKASPETQREISAKAGFSQGYLSKLMNDADTNPTVDVLEGLDVVLGVEVWQFFKDPEPPPPPPDPVMASLEDFATVPYLRDSTIAAGEALVITPNADKDGELSFSVGMVRKYPGPRRRATTCGPRSVTCTRCWMARARATRPATCRSSRSSRRSPATSHRSMSHASCVSSAQARRHGPGWPSLRRRA